MLHLFVCQKLFLTSNVFQAKKRKLEGKKEIKMEIAKYHHLRLQCFFTLARYQIDFFYRKELKQKSSHDKQGRIEDSLLQKLAQPFFLEGAQYTFGPFQG